MNKLNSVLLTIALSLVGCSSDVSTMAIVGATVIDGTGANPRVATVIVRDGLITAVTPTAEIPSGADVIDGTGKFVMPGLADMHVHFASGGFGVKQDAEDLLRQFLYYGVTTILNLGATGGDPATIDQLRSDAAARGVQVPQIYAAGWLITVPGSHPVSTIMEIPEGTDPDSVDWLGRGVRIVSSADEMRSAVREVAAAGMNCVKIVVESGPTMLGDDHPQMDRILIDAAVGEARLLGLPVFAHATSIDELEDVVGAGVQAVVHLVAESEHPSTALLESMAAADIMYVPTLGMAISADAWGEPDQNLTDSFIREGVPEEVINSILQSDLFPDSAPSEGEWQWRARRLAALKSAVASEVVVVAGTDTGNPVTFPGFSMHHELELLVESGMSPMQALLSATRRPSELLGEDSVFGTIEPGKRADLLVLGANPLDDIRNTRTLEIVVREGEVVDREAFLQSRNSK